VHRASIPRATKLKRRAKRRSPRARRMHNSVQRLPECPSFRVSFHLIPHSLTTTLLHFTPRFTFR
jgi:hypothetical protein